MDVCWNISISDYDLWLTELWSTGIYEDEVFLHSIAME